MVEPFVAGKMVELHANDEEFTMETRDASPAHLLMKIESFYLPSEHGIDKYESTEFHAGGYKWKLIIYPNGRIKSEKDEDHHISVYLAIVDTISMPVDWGVTAAFSILLYNQVLNNYLCFQGKMRRFHALKTQWGFSKLISKESFRAPGNGFLVDDICVFGAEVAVLETQCVSRQYVSIPYKRVWKISRFSKFSRANGWRSEVFMVGNRSWQMTVYPDGLSKSVSIYLNRSAGAKIFGSHEKVIAYRRLVIKNQLNDQHYVSESHSRGCSAYLWFSQVLDPNKGFLVGDCFLIEVEIAVKVVQENRQLKNGPSCFGLIFG